MHGRWLEYIFFFIFWEKLGGSAHFPPFRWPGSPVHLPWHTLQNTVALQNTVECVHHSTGSTECKNTFPSSSALSYLSHSPVTVVEIKHGVTTVKMFAESAFVVLHVIVSDFLWARSNLLLMRT